MAEQPHSYDDRSSTIQAILAVVLLTSSIIALFMFITWVTYNAD